MRTTRREGTCEADAVASGYGSGRCVCGDVLGPFAFAEGDERFRDERARVS